MSYPVVCDHCGSGDISVESGQVVHNSITYPSIEARAIFKCGSCNSAWVNTDPNIIELVWAAKNAPVAGEES